MGFIWFLVSKYVKAFNIKATDFTRNQAQQGQAVSVSILLIYICHAIKTDITIH